MTRRIDAHLDPLGMLMGANLVEAQPSRLYAETQVTRAPGEGDDRKTRWIDD